MAHSIRYFITIIFFCFLSNANYASDYHYEKRQIANQNIHIVTIDPHDYDIELVKANKGVGRKTVSGIAKDSHANIAINAGFFEISSNRVFAVKANTRQQEI